MIHEGILKATIADNHLSEEDIKNQYIQPNMETKGWDMLYPEDYKLFEE